MHGGILRSMPSSLDPTAASEPPTTPLAADGAALVRTLVLLRHAKAESSSSGGDIARVLSPRGTADATAAGTWLAQSGLHADLVVCSPAARTRETWAAAVEGGASATRVDNDRRVYDAEPADLLQVLRETPDDVRVLVLVGHAPGVPALTSELADPAGSDADALAEVAQRYPTTALSRLEYRGEWAELGPQSAALVEFAVPRA